MTYRFVFVLEQGLGHTVHGMNIEAALRHHPDINATILRVRPGETAGVRPLPFVHNWSVQMSWAARAALRRELGRAGADCVFVHTQVAALFARGIMRRVPTIVSLDATPIDFDRLGGAYRHPTQPASVEWAKLAVNRRALAGATAAVTWSRWAARSVVHDYGIPSERVHPIYPGVHLSNFQPRHREHDGAVRLLFVGGDFERKGGHDLLAAAASLGPAVEVDVATSTSAPVDVPPGVTVRVHRDVKPNSAEMTELYGRADLFVLPTRGDCTPLVIAEAMASGLPVIATTVGSIPDMVAPGHNGILVAPGRPDDLAAAISALVSSPDRRAEMGRASRLRAEQDHDAEANCSRIFELMRTAALESPGRRIVPDLAAA